MLKDPALISYGVSAALYTILAILIASRYFRRDIDRALVLASFITALWSAAIVAQGLFREPGFLVRYLLELLRDTAWILLLFAILRTTFKQGKLGGQLKKMLGIAAIILVMALLTLGTIEYALKIDLVDGKTRLIGQLALSLLGLSLVEQIWRNAPAFGRSSLKYLCIGVAIVFGYDFVMYADALLLSKIDGSFWDARGFVNAALVPMFAINAMNTRKQPVDFQLSRSAVFHAGTLLFAGGYLLFLAAGGYYVKAMGGAWGEVLQIVLVAVSIAFLITLLMSRRIRARLMVFIGQNFFDYKYDYREEWLRMTRELADLSNEPPLAERVIRILAGLVESNTGAIWLRNEQGNYMLKASLGLATPKYTIIDQDSALPRYFQDQEWVISLREYRSDPDCYNLQCLPDAITSTQGAWLIIPLYQGNDLYGIAVIGEPYAKVELNWENFDLIKVVARQACNLLAQADAQQRLSRAMQFEAVSKASAFMAHDLKTLIAQLSLMVRNAPKHRNNPAFFDDMISTTDHAVRKMTNLVEHIRKPADGQGRSETCVDMTDLIKRQLETWSKRQPIPVVEGDPGPVFVQADTEQLASILGHLIQNAQDATPPDGEITLNLKSASDNVVLFIQDTGAGMTEEFLRNRLFKPFESTKGLTGMGIGAYQAREYIRELGGDIDVSSTPDLGTCFSVQIPLARKHANATLPESVFDADIPAEGVNYPSNSN